MPKFPRPTQPTWALALLAAGLASNYFFGCGTNLIAFAVVAVLTLSFRAGALVAIGIWFESQLLGFGVLHYPHDPMTLAWGVALGLGTLVAALVAAGCKGRAHPFAFPAAFAAYELSLTAFALVTHAGLGAFAPAIVWQIFASNALVAIVAFATYVATGWIETAIARVVRPQRPA